MKGERLGWLSRLSHFIFFEKYVVDRTLSGICGTPKMLLKNILQTKMENNKNNNKNNKQKKREVISSTKMYL